MQAVFPPASDIPPVDDDEKPQPVVGLKPTAAFGFATPTTNTSAFGQRPMGCFGGQQQQPPTGCVFPRPANGGIPFNPEQKMGGGLLGGFKKDDTNTNANIINASIYAQLSTMRTQISQLNNGIDKMYELLAKNH